MPSRFLGSEARRDQGHMVAFGGLLKGTCYIITQRTLPSMDLSYLLNNQRLSVVFFLYAATLLIQGLLLGTHIMVWNRLPSKFRMLSATQVTLFFAAFSVCMLHLVTVNNTLTCHIGRKLAYTLFYMGFLVFDYYQMFKIQIITASKGWKLVPLYLAYWLRFISYCYNLYEIKGVTAIDMGDGMGPCTTKFNTDAVLQEHFISIFFQVVLAAYLLVFITRTASQSSFSQRLKSILDIEVIGFVVYLLIEIAYLLAFLMIQSNYVSIHNALYLNVPVLIFAVNLYEHWKRKKDHSSRPSQLHLLASGSRSNPASPMSPHDAKFSPTSPRDAKLMTEISRGASLPSPNRMYTRTPEDQVENPFLYKVQNAEMKYSHHMA